MKKIIYNLNHFCKLLPLCFLFFYLLPSTSRAQITQTFTSSGQFVVPAGVTSVQVQAWGGGGAGGGVVGGALFTAKAGGGGAGGSFTRVTNVAVTPGSTISVTVGAGGTDVNEAAGTPGGTSSFGSGVPVNAVGGAAGQIGTNGAGAAATTGITYNGGSGAAASGANSGGGGGGPGTAGSGGNASGTTAGIAGAGGGSAGAPGLTAGGNGNNATGIAAGGSGGKSASAFNGAARRGGNGAPGQVLVTFTCPAYSLSTTTASGPFCTASASVVTLTSSSLPAGSYIVTYNLSGGNTATGNTAAMTVAAGNPGTGTFTTPVLTGSLTPTTITITGIKSGATGALCSSAITENNTASVEVNPLTISAGAPFSKTCVSNIDGGNIGEADEPGNTYSWSPSTGLSSDTVSNPFANPTTTTTYTLTKTNAESGCVLQASVTVTVSNTPITVSAGNPFTKTCAVNPNGAAIGEANVPGNTYSWSPSAGLSSATVSNPTASPTVTTTYTVVKTNTTSGCTATDQVTVTVDIAAPTVSAGSPFTKTCVANTSGAQIGEEPESGYTYSWSPTAGLSDPTISNPIANPTTTTTYTISKTSPVNGCAGTASVTVTVNNTLSVNAGADFTKTCVTNPSGKVIGEANVSGNTYSWTPSEGLSSDSVSNPTANPTVTTTYTVTKMNAANGCVATDDIVVTVNLTTPVADAGADFTKTCVTNPSGAPIGEAFQSGHTYSWSPTTGLSSSTVSNPTANPTVTTTYTVTKTNSGSGCTHTDTVTVTVNTTPPTVAALTGTQNVCVGSTTIFSSTTEGGVWGTSNAAVATVNAGTVTGISAGNATISYTVTGANGCTTTVTRIATVNPLPASVTASGGTAICNGSSTVITGSATIPYVVTGTIGDNFNGSPSFASSGTATSNGYVFTQKNSGDTAGLTTITNNVDASKFMMAVGASFGNGNTTSTLTSPVINTNGYSALTFGYVHSFTKGNTGTNTAVVQVSIDSGSTWTTVKTYSTNQGASNNFVADNINLNSYINKPNFRIRFNTTLTVNLASAWWAIDNPVLTTTTTVLPLYSWMADTATGVNGLPAGAATPSAGNASISVNPSADTNYTLVAKDPLTGCTQNAAPIHVTVKPIPVADAVANDTYCNGVTTPAIQLTGSPSGVTFDISGGAAIGLANAANVTSIPAFNTVTGSANITITPKLNGCAGLPVTYNVTVNPTPMVTNPGDQNYCDGATASSIVLSGSPSGVTYDILGGAAVGLADANNITSIPSFTAIPGNAVVSIIPHANNCTGSVQTYTITVNPTPTVTAPADQIYCADATASSIVLNGTPSGVTYDISGGSAVGLADAVNVTAIPSFTAVAGSAMVSIMPRVNGCAGSSVSYAITVNPLVTPTFTQVEPICTGGMLADLPTISNNGVTGTWSPALDNTITTEYTFTPTAGQCTSVVLTTMTIVVNENITYYADSDGDTYGNLAVTASSCTGAPTGYVANSTDCNDGNANVYQSALLYIDADGDGYDAGQSTVCYGAAVPSGYSATTLGTDCNDADSTLTTNCTPSSSVVNIKMFIEGYYTGGGSMTSVALNQDYVSDAANVEVMTVELHDATTFGLVASATGMLHTDGTLSVSFSTAPSGSFYIAVKGSNILQTWTSDPQTVGATPLAYDFTTSASQAYGDNMREIETGVFAVYSGDINQDEVTDNSDLDTLYPDIDNSNFGVLATDLNGDGVVDNSDLDNIFINIDNSRYSNHP